MYKTIVNEINDFFLLGLTFITTLLIRPFNRMLKINLTPELLSDFITLVTQLGILAIVIYKFKILREKNKKNKDDRDSRK